MAYTVTNFKYKKQLREACTKAQPEVYQPGPFGPVVPDGVAAIEGPHFPEPHRWYATVEVKGGKIVRFIK